MHEQDALPLPAVGEQLRGEALGEPRVVKYDVTVIEVAEVLVREPDHGCGVVDTAVGEHGVEVVQAAHAVVPDHQALRNLDYALRAAQADAAIEREDAGEQLVHLWQGTMPVRLWT